MSAISLKSISGITSITTPAGVDNVFTIHSNDTTERFRIDQNGNLNIAGIITATNFVKIDGSSLGGFSPDAQHNLFAGTDAGASLNSSSGNNVLLGQDAGDSITDGENNICIGLRAGQAITSSDKNTCIGNDAGRNFSAGDSVFIGWYAGASASSNGNVCIGHNAGSEANGNETAYGYSSGPTASYSGTTNVCMGFASGNGLRSSASRNTILGPGAGRNDSVGQVNINGSDNIILGSYSSLSSVSVSNECVIGAVYGSSKAITHFRIPGIGVSFSEGGAVIAGVCTATSFSGDGSNLTGVSGVSIANQGNDRLITATGTTDALNAESNLTWNGSVLSATGSDAQIRLYDNSGGTNSAFRLMAYNGINYIQSGQAFSSGSSADLVFSDMFGANEKVRISSDGHLGINVASAAQLASSKMLTLRPDNDDGIRFVRPGDGHNNPNVHLDLTTTTSGSAFPSGEAYTTKYKTTNCDQIFETYEGGGTGGNISFRTRSSSGESLRINKDGYVTKPNHPAFIAGRTGGNQTFTVGTFPFNVARLNVGNHYNTSTYKFVAPVAGVYYFYGQVYYNNGTGAYRVGFRKTPNGGSAFMLNTAQLGVTGNDNQQNISIIESLAVGDTVELYSDQNASIQCYYNINDNTYGAHTYFMGYLIG